MEEEGWDFWSPAACRATGDGDPRKLERELVSKARDVDVEACVSALAAQEATGNLNGNIRSGHGLKVASAGPCAGMGLFAEA